MPEAVIVDAIRTPIGRAAKGSLKDVRADDLAAVPLKAVVERNPDVDFAQTQDIMMGCGFQQCEQGYNIGRNAQLLAAMLPPGEKPRAKAERVVDEAVRLESLTNDLLRFVRTGTIKREPVDPGALVREAALSIKGEVEVDIATAGEESSRIDCRRGSMRGERGG